MLVDAGSVSATISSAIGGNFEALAINPAAATTAVTDTIDTTTVSLTATPSVAEGGSIVYTASLTSSRGNAGDGDARPTARRSPSPPAPAGAR